MYCRIDFASVAKPAEPVPDEKAAVVAVKNSPDAPLVKHYRTWFLEYASYVILDRAVPHLDDGLKPVQRRILHTLWEMDDGRFHKVANVVGRRRIDDDAAGARVARAALRWRSVGHAGGARLASTERVASAGTSRGGWRSISSPIPSGICM